MRNHKIVFAVVGAGAVASHHVRALQQIENVEIVLCDKSPDKARLLAEKQGVLWCQDFDRLLRNPEVDVVDVTVPSGFHAEIGIQAAQAGKHVVVEKPIDVSLQKADELIASCRLADVTLGVISQYRFMDSTQELYRYLNAGKLGTLIQGDAYIKWYRSQSYYDSGAWRGTFALDGGGPFINQGIHFIDLLLSAMGPVRSVYAKTKNVAHPSIEVEDLGMAMVEFQSGAYGVIQASTAIYPGLPAKLDIHGTKGTISLEGEQLAFKHVEGEEAFKAANVVAAGAASPMSIDVTPFVRQFRDIIAAIRGKKQPLVSGTVARQALQLILAIYESARTGMTVYLLTD